MATPIKKIAHPVKKIPHERLYELLIAAITLIVLAIGVSFITPYSQQSQYELAEEDTSQTTIYRARVVAFYGDTLSVAMLDGAARGTTVMVPLSMALAICGVFLVWHTKWRAVAICGAVLYVLLIGFSRLYLGVHFPTDIIGGWLLGAGWMSLVIGCVLLLSRGKPATKEAA